MASSARTQFAEALRALAVVIGEGINVPLPSDAELAVPVWTGVHEWDVKLVQAFAKEVGAEVFTSKNGIAALLTIGPLVYTVYAIKPLALAEMLERNPDDSPK